MSLRSIVRVGSTLSISGEGTSDVPMVLYQPFSIQTMVHVGSSFSIFGILNLASTLSVLSVVHLGSSLSLRSGLRLGSALSVMDSMHMGSSLSLRTFARFGSSLSVMGSVRLGSRLTVFDNICLDSSKVAKICGWSIKFNTAASRFQFIADSGGEIPLSITPTGGELHGVWSVESIVSASDRRLKREIAPLASSLRKTASTSDSPTASELLQALNPKRYEAIESASVSFKLPGMSRSREGQEPAKIRFEADEVGEVLPDLVWPPLGADAPESGVKKGILYQDFLALLTLAAQERQRRLEDHMLREQEETARIQSQESMIAVLEAQVSALRGRFGLLRSRNPTPPPVSI